jgi:hypothetical protein
MANQGTLIGDRIEDLWSYEETVDNRTAMHNITQSNPNITKEKGESGATEGKTEQSKGYHSY